MSKSSSSSSRLKVRTAVSLSKTRPLREKKIQKLQKSLKSKAEASTTTTRSGAVTDKTVQRVKPASQLAAQERYQRWLLPSRIAFFLNGLYFIAFATLCFVGLFSNYQIIRPFFILPFETEFSSFFLVEASAMFALIAGLLFLCASRHPQQYRWFYFLHILLLLPYHFCSNLLKMQIELTPDFQNYLYFDTITTAILWFVYIISISAYLKPSKISS